MLERSLAAIGGILGLIVMPCGRLFRRFRGSYAMSRKGTRCPHTHPLTKQDGGRFRYLCGVINSILGKVTPLELLELSEPESSDECSEDCSDELSGDLSPARMRGVLHKLYSGRADILYLSQPLSTSVDVILVGYSGDIWIRYILL